MTTVSQAVLAAYMQAMMQAFAPASAPGRRLAEWLFYNQGVTGLDFRAALAEAASDGAAPERPDLEKPLPLPLWQALSAALAQIAGARAQEQDELTANIEAFASAVALDPIESALLRFVLFTDYDDSFDQLCGNVVATRAVDSIGLMVLCLGCGAGDVRSRLLQGPLPRLNLIGTANTLGDRFRYFVPYRIVRALAPASRGIADIERQLIGTPMRPLLSPADYDHVAPERDFTLRLLRGAIAARRPGTNVLIYGAPGTGKSEFCKMIAREVGCALFGVGEADEDGDEPSRWDRLDALRLADRLAIGRGNALLLFDEMEDILQRGERSTSDSGTVRRAGSKVYFNRLLEQNQVPVLWTANMVDEFDPAFLRRMTFSFEMKPLPSRARARLWEDFAHRQGLSLPAPQAETLARRHKVSPGLMTGAVQAVAMAGGAPEEIDFVVGAIAKPFLRCVPQMPPAPGPFALELANADVDLSRLQAALAAPGAPRDISLCFYGPPGTGKSAFARQLAGAIGLEALLKRGSDLLSKWIGETERNLARAFEEAREENAFLIIDEAEGFLWNRAGAEKSWEVTMVNELLVQMETHPLPFACTTNHLDRIDSAAVRRFAFKVKFDFLTPAQSAEAYRRFFASEPPAALGQATNLTPGDFAVVAKKLRLLGQLGEAAPDLVRLLEQEVTAKNLRAMKIGF
jgi:ATP-dependent 26S proteasome regulatory subunit